MCVYVMNNLFQIYPKAQCIPIHTYMYIYPHF